MSELPVIASGYAIFLAVVAALLSHASRRRTTNAEWPHAELLRLRGVLARALLVLAGVILILAAARHYREAGSVGCLGCAAIVVGVASRYS